MCVGLWRLPRPRGTTHTTYSLLLHVSLLVPDRVHHSPTARVDFGKNLDDLVQAVFCELLRMLVIERPIGSLEGLGGGGEYHPFVAFELLTDLGEGGKEGRREGVGGEGREERDGRRGTGGEGRGDGKGGDRGGERGDREGCQRVRYACA